MHVCDGIQGWAAWDLLVEPLLAPPPSLALLTVQVSSGSHYLKLIKFPLGRSCWSSRASMPSTLGRAMCLAAAGSQGLEIAVFSGERAVTSLALGAAGTIIQTESD